MAEQSNYVQLTEREEQIVEEALRYADGTAPGLPGHNLLIIIAKQARALRGIGAMFSALNYASEGGRKDNDV